MQIAVLLYEGVTALDAVGPFEVLSNLPGADVVLVGETPGPVRTEQGRLGLVVDRALAEVPAPDVVVVPGGAGHRALLADGPVQRWLLKADRTSTWTTSVCTGALVLAGAGLLHGRRATTHWLALDRLAAAGAEPADARVVVDGKYVTAAGVSAGIDMALALAGRLCGDQAAQAVQLGLEYDPRPPYPGGSAASAPPALVAALRSRAAEIIGGPPR